MNFEEFINSLNKEDQIEFNRLISLLKDNKSNIKEVRSNVARLLMSILNRSNQNNLIGQLMSQFNDIYINKNDAISQISDEDLVKLLPYPLSAKINQIIKSKMNLDQNINEPQFGYQICSVLGLYLRFLGVLLINFYANRIDKKNIKINNLIVKTIRAPSDGSWLSLTRELLKSLTKENNDKNLLLLKSNLEKKIPNTNNKKISIYMILEDLISFRNKLVHGEKVDHNLIVERFKDIINVFKNLTFLLSWKIFVRVNKKTFYISGSLPKEIKEKVYNELPDKEICLVIDNDIKNYISLYPLLHFNISSNEVDINELFFLNSGSVNKLNYISYKTSSEIDGKTIGTYDEFQNFLSSSIPTPNLPPDPKINFDDLILEKNKLFVGRDDIQKEFSTYVNKTKMNYGVIKALAGQGKTALMCHLIEENKNVNHCIYHFCMSQDSRDRPEVMLRSLIAQLCEIFKLNITDWISENLKDLKENLFPSLLSQITRNLKNKKILIFIDALDESNRDIEKSIGKAIPRVNLENIKFIISYRVERDNKNIFVDKTLDHLKDLKILNFKTANPMKGLTSNNIKEFLNKIFDNQFSEKLFLDFVWECSQNEQKNGADPFYLNFFSESVRENKIILNRIETVPKNISQAFDNVWLNLPKDNDFLVHKILCLLALMFDYGDDQMMTEYFNNQKEYKENSLTSTDIAVARASIGKLLIYDGDRYKLFHDRLKYFLVGDQPDPLKEFNG